MVFFSLVTTGWIFDISLLCEDSINQSKKHVGKERREMPSLLVVLLIFFFVLFSNVLELNIISFIFQALKKKCVQFTPRKDP